MNQRVAELIFKVADKIGAEVKAYQSGQSLETISLIITLPNGRKQEVLASEITGNEYVRFVSVVRIYTNSQDLKTNLNFEKILRINYGSTEGSYAIFDFPSSDRNTPSPALVFVSNQYIKTADFEEIEDKILTTAQFADELEKILGGGVDNF